MTTPTTVKSLPRSRGAKQVQDAGPRPVASVSTSACWRLHLPNQILPACRTRRIKCDEAKPICKNCVKSRRECQFQPQSPPEEPSPTSLSRSPSKTSPVDSIQSPLDAPYTDPQFYLRSQPQMHMPMANFPYSQDSVPQQTYMQQSQFHSPQHVVFHHPLDHSHQIPHSPVPEQFQQPYFPSSSIAYNSSVPYTPYHVTPQQYWVADPSYVHGQSMPTTLPSQNTDEQATYPYQPT